MSVTARWIRRAAPPVAAVLAAAALSGCAAKPTDEECKAGITHMMEIQIDEVTARSAAAAPYREQAAAFLKSQIPSMLRPELIEQCVARAKKADMQCTLTATSSDQLVKQCHWKPMAGPRGTTLGF